MGVRRKITLSLIILIALAALLAGAFWVYRRNRQSSATQPMSFQQPMLVNIEASNTVDWGTYTNPEDFYSIQYPNRGQLLVKYTAEPKRSVLSWKNKGDYDIEIYFLDNPDDLTPKQWLTQNFADTTNATSVVVNGMNGTAEYWPSDGTLSVFLDNEIDGLPITYRIDFVCYYHEQCPPPFWQKMLSSFRAQQSDANQYDISTSTATY